MSKLLATKAGCKETARPRETEKQINKSKPRARPLQPDKIHIQTKRCDCPAGNFVNRSACLFLRSSAATIFLPSKFGGLIDLHPDRLTCRGFVGRTLIARSFP
jgi:hypothetical protein